LGDTLCAIPAFRMIRRELPDTRLTLLCDQPGNGKVAMEQVLERLGIFEEIFTYTSNRDFRSFRAFIRVIRTAQPDAMLFLSQARENSKRILRKKWLVRLLGIRQIYFRLPSMHTNEWVDNEPKRLDSQLREIGFRGPKPAYDIPVDETARESIEKRLLSKGVSVHCPYMVFCPGGKAATQRWPVDRYAVVLKQIHAMYQLPIVLMGTTMETEAFMRTSLEVPVFPIDTNLAEMFELMRRACVYFGNDTGPMHVAAAVGCPVAVVMSARNQPGAWDPDVNPSLVIRERTSCENCFLSECIQQKHRCMTGISSNRVFGELSGFLEKILAQ